MLIMLILENRTADVVCGLMRVIHALQHSLVGRST